MLLCFPVYDSFFCLSIRVWGHKYIQDQELEDQMGDQLSFKEYEDPFKDTEPDDDDSPEVPADRAAKSKPHV